MIDNPLKFKPGTMLQLRGTHMIKRSVPDNFNWYYNIQDESKIIKENDIVIVLGLAESPWNEDKWMLEHEEQYPVIEILHNGEYGYIKQFRLMCSLYREVANA